jgi:hypothetical protein
MPKRELPGVDPDLFRLPAKADESGRVFLLQFDPGGLVLEDVFEDARSPRLCSQRDASSPSVNVRLRNDRSDVHGKTGPVVPYI